MKQSPEKLITAVILTHNEERHIARCLASIAPLCARMIVVDSHSTDDTRTMAENAGAEVLTRKWPNNHSEQLNWGISQANATTPFMLRIDADEYLSDELQAELAARLPSLDPAVSGIVVPRLVVFQNRPIRWGGFYPQWLLRVWRTGTATCESRMMDEHMMVNSGKLMRFRHNLVDHNLNDIHWWTNKHNNYARREAAELLCLRHNLLTTNSIAAKGETQARIKRFIKVHIYSRLPLGVRAGTYFCYRFFFQLGFLDHPRVWTFHFLQAAWYRTLVDVNVREFQDAVGSAGPKEQIQYMLDRWNVDLRKHLSGPLS